MSKIINILNLKIMLKLNRLFLKKNVGILEIVQIFLIEKCWYISSFFTVVNDFFNWKKIQNIHYLLSASFKS